MPVLYFVRHGETDFNVAQRLQGRYQTSLNARGRQQAEVVGDILHDLFERDGRGADEFFYVSSPLARAYQSMEIVRATLGLDPAAYDTDDAVINIDGNFLRRMGRPDAAGNSGAQSGTCLSRKRDHHKWDFTPPGGESYRDVAQRVTAWYATLTRDTVAVAHGGIARALMANFS